MLESLFNKKIDAFLVFCPKNRYYFTRFKASYGCVLLCKSEKIFFTDSRYYLSAKKALTDFKIICVTNANIFDTIKSELARLNASTVGYEDDFLTVSRFKNIKSNFSEYNLKPASSIIGNLRMVKTDDEIAYTKQAQEIAEKSLQKIVQSIKAGITERELQVNLIYETLKNGAEDMAFEAIVAFGENSACPHHRSGIKKLEKNDIILIDFGAVVKGYHSDMTRTFCLGEPKEQLNVIHNIVLEAQNYALRHIKAGMTCHEADSLAREYIRANGYDNEFTHSLGHGVGLEIHESPRIGENSDTMLLPNMIITIEPGIYIEGVGGVRIEDLVVVTENGINNLTNFDKNINL